MKKITVKIYLVDENGNSPCFGVDENIEIEAADHTELQKKIADAKHDFAHHLVVHEDFLWSDVVGYDIAKNEKNFEIKASY